MLNIYEWDHGTILSTLQIFRKHCYSYCSIFKNYTVFLSLLLKPACPKNIVLLLLISLAAVMVLSISHLLSVSGWSLYSFVNLRKPDDVWSLLWVIYSGILLFVVDRPLTTFLNPSDLKNTLEPLDVDRYSILFFPRELEISIIN